MAGFLSEIHLWSLKNQYSIPENDIACFTYHEKGEQGEKNYAIERQHFVESRDSTWTPPNKRPEKLKDNLKELEELLLVSRCIKCQWVNRRRIQLLLSNGILVTIAVSQHTGDVDSVYIDKSLLGKLSAENGCDALLLDGWILIVYPDKSKLDVVTFSRKYSLASEKKMDKLSSHDMKITQCVIPGPIGIKLKRKLATNANQDMVCVSWCTSSRDACPWSPIQEEAEQANIVLLILTGQQCTVMAFTKTEFEPIGIQFSLSAGQRQILAVEQAVSASDTKPIDLCVYDHVDKKLQRLVIASLTSQAELLCYDHTPAEDKVVFGFADATLSIFDYKTGQTDQIKTSFVPSHIQWHSSGLVMIAAGTSGQLQLYDMALSTLSHQLNAESCVSRAVLDLHTYLRSTQQLDHIMWVTALEDDELIAECTDSLLFVFDRGPVGVLRYNFGVMSQGQLAPIHIFNEYIKNSQIDQSVIFLVSMNWNVDGQFCYMCLDTIVNHLLKFSLNYKREKQLERALGTFYKPVKPLSEDVILEYRNSVSKLARKFFHHLLRFARFEKAFLLAVDIEARDLFMDIHYRARQEGELVLAQVAREKADELLSESDETDSTDGDYSQESDDESGAPPPVPPRPAIQRKPYTHDRPLPALPNDEDQPDSTPFHLIHNNVTESTFENMEDEIKACFTASLLDEIPPPQLPEDETQPSTTQVSNKDVKVIHFGMI